MTLREEYLKVCLSSSAVMGYLGCYAHAISMKLGIEEEDVRQDLLLHLIERADGYDPQKSAMPTYAWVCLRTARNRVFERHLSKKRVHAPFALLGDIPSAHEDWDANIHLRDSLSHLDPKANQYATLLALGYSKAAVGRKLGVNKRQMVKLNSQVAMALA